MNKYLEEFEKYRQYKLPALQEVFSARNALAVKYKILEYKDDQGLVETVKSGQQRWRTLHWIRKQYNVQ